MPQRATDGPGRRCSPDLTAWLHDGLRDASLPAICIETRQANAAMKTMPNKTDRNDARALAQSMRTGWFRAVHVKSRRAGVESRSLRDCPPHPVGAADCAAHMPGLPSLLQARGAAAMGSRHIGPTHGRKRPRDTHVLYAVRYEDGGSGYVRVPPGLASSRPNGRGSRSLPRGAGERGTAAGEDRVSGAGALNARAVAKAASRLGIRARFLDVRDSRDLESAFQAIRQSPPEAVQAIADPFLGGPLEAVVAFARETRLPAMYPFRHGAEAGGLISYAAEYQSCFDAQPATSTGSSKELRWRRCRSSSPRNSSCC
jgi:hypothetical protein